MKRHWGIGVFKFLLLVAIVLAGFGQAVLQLWNLLMPAIFGLPSLGYWQAVGLMALSWILFGGLRGFGMIRGGGHRRRLAPRPQAAVGSDESRRARGIPEGDARVRRAGCAESRAGLSGGENREEPVKAPPGRKSR